MNDRRKRGNILEFFFHNKENSSDKKVNCKKKKKMKKNLKKVRFYENHCIE